MARKSLKPQLNQIRAWVRQGRTDAWIAHQLEVSTSDLREFRRQHDLSAEGEDDGATDVDLRDEIEAELEAVAETEGGDADAEAEADEGDDETDDEDDEEADGGEAEGRPRRRRRRGRRGGRGRPKSELEATFDHGERDGFGLWLDPAVQDIPAYADNWSGKRKVKVRVESDQIVIVRSEDGDSGD